MRLALVLLLMSGCGPVFVGELDPRPNVFLVPSPDALALRLGPEVPETLPGDAPEVPQAILVEHWHESLARGFHTAFDPYFANGVTSGTTLVVRATPITFHVLLRATHAVMRYRAERVAADGSVLQRFAGSVVVTEPFQLYDLRAVTAHLVEGMYEQIASQLGRRT